MSDFNRTRLPDPLGVFGPEGRGDFRLSDLSGPRMGPSSLTSSFTPGSMGPGGYGMPDPFLVFKNLEDDSDIKRGLMGTLGAAARGLSSIFEPFQLSQDLLFAAVAGLADPNSSFKDRFLADEGFWRTLARYAPGGEAPRRPATGAEILELFGVENEQARKWVGLGLDLFADPLLAGAWVKGIGVVAKTGGKALGISDDAAKAIIKLGDSMDRAFSPLGVYRLVPKELRASMEHNAAELFKRAANARVFWNRTESGATYGDLLLARRTALNLQFPTFMDDLAGVGDDVIDRAGAGARRFRFGDAVASAQSRARGTAISAQERAAILAGEARDVLESPLDDAFRDVARIFTPDEERSFVQRGLELIGMKRYAGNSNKGLPTALKTYIEKNGATFMDEHGLLLMRAEDITSAELRAFMQEVPGRGKRFDAIRKAGADDMDEYLEGVRRMARKTGVDPEVAADRARTYVQRLTEAEALLGYHLSGTGFVRKKFFEQVLAKSGTDEKAVALARDAWERAILRANKGEDALDTVTGIRKPTGAPGRNAPDPNQPRPPQQQAPTPTGDGPFQRPAPFQQPDPFQPSGSLLSDRMGNQGPFARGDRGSPPRDLAGGRLPVAGEGDSFYTIRELLEGNELFSALSLSDFMSGLTKGHLRRTYGIFQAGENFNDWVQSVQKGKVFLSNVVDESLGGVSAAFNAEADLVRTLIRDLQSSKRATVLPKETVFNHLIENGVNPRRAREFLIEMVRAQNPHLGETLARVQQYADLYAHQAGSPGQNFGTFGRSFFTERNVNISREDLEILGEFAQPLISISETGTAARVSVAFQQSMAEIYDLAKQNGYVISRAETYTDPVSRARFMKIPEGESGIWGAFAGKQVHPFLKKELLHMMQDRGTRQVALGRLRNIITAGYLASPNVMVANAAGGIMQAAALGIAPPDMVAAMARTLKPLLRHDNGDEVYGVLDTLAKYFDVDEATLIGQNFVKEFKNLEMTAAGVGPEGVRKFLGQFADFVEAQLQRPGVGNARTRWLGLDGFQFVERWLKVSAFDAQKRKLMNLEGLAEGVAEKLAAETARLAVFDYSEIPRLFKTLRDSGVLLFPGFNYFLMPRLARAAMQRPGTIAVADRMSDAITTANVSEDERLALYASMPPWLREEHGSVISKYRGPDGEMRYVAIPMNQLVPTSSLAGNPWGESLSSLGIFRPFQEVLTALIRGDGEAIYSGQYGQQVFDPGASAGTQALQSVEFLVSNLMPGMIRKLGLDPQSVRAALLDPTQSPRGVVPKLFQTAFQIPNEIGELGYSISEISRGRPDRQLRDEVLSFTLRAPQVLSLSGPLASYGKAYQQAVRLHSAETEHLRGKIRAASLANNQEELQRLIAQLQRKQQQFIDTWQPALEAVQMAQSGGSLQNQALRGASNSGGGPGLQAGGLRGLPDPFGVFQGR